MLPTVVDRACLLYSASLHFIQRNLTLLLMENFSLGCLQMTRASIFIVDHEWSKPCNWNILVFSCMLSINFCGL